MIALLPALLAAVDPCAPVPPADAAAPAVAAAYRRVAEEEAARGQADTAIAARRAALALDPTDERSRRELERACVAEPAARRAFRRGLAAMKRGELTEAAEAFAAARTPAPDPSAALLEGVCLYELGRADEGRRALEEAALAPAHAHTAELYLALLALDAGEAGEALRWLEPAATDPALERVAGELVRAARQARELTLALQLEAGWSSNPRLDPEPAPLDGASDAWGGLSASLVHQPRWAHGGYARAAGRYARQTRFGELDAGIAVGAVGWQLGRGRRGALAEYAFEYRSLGGGPFSTTHRLGARAGAPLGPAAVTAAYQVRLESYPDVRYAGFSGASQLAEVRLESGPGARLALGAGYRLARAGVAAPELSYTEHGPVATARLHLTARLRAAAWLALGLRDYDAVDPALGLRRSDTSIEGAWQVEWDLSELWTLRGWVEARWQASNAASYSLTQLAPMVGLGCTLGS